MDRNLRALLIETVLLIVVILDVILFWESTFLSSMISLIIVIIAFVFFHKKEDIIFYLFGALLGPIAEIICIRFGVWQYSNPFLMGIPLWLPVLWGFAFLVTRRVRDTLFRLDHLRIHYLHHPSVRIFELFIMYDLILYSLMIILTSVLWRDNLALFLALGLITIMSLLKYHLKEDVFFVVFGAVLGPVVEIICIFFGAWNYGNPSFLNIPIWLPLAYAVFAIVVRRTSVTVVNYMFRR